MKHACARGQLLHVPRRKRMLHHISLGSNAMLCTCKGTARKGKVTRGTRDNGIPMRTPGNIHSRPCTHVLFSARAWAAVTRLLSGVTGASKSRTRACRAELFVYEYA